MFGNSELHSAPIFNERLCSWRRLCCLQFRQRETGKQAGIMRKPFMALRQFRIGGDSMKTALAASALLIACLLPALVCASENEDRFQNIGGDYGRNIISFR